MGQFVVYRETREHGKEHWGERYREKPAINYAEFVFEKYRPGGEYEREDDPLIRVTVVEQRSGEEKWRKEVELVE